MKKETTLSVLKEIRDLLKEKQEKSIETEVSGDWFEIDFPEVTSEEIIKRTGNKTSTGTPILYYPKGWYEHEAFYTTEKTRKGKSRIKLELVHKGKTFDECKVLVENEGGEMLNFPELLYFLVEYEKKTGRHLLEDYKYSWTSSRSSGGGLVIGGGFDSDGMGVDGRLPVSAGGRLGVLFSRRS